MKGIIFDLDGTLWDSIENVTKSWNDTLEKYPEVTTRITFDDMKGVMGLVIDDIAKIFFPYLDKEKRMEIVNDCCKHENVYLAKHGAILYDRLEETLKELAKNHKLFIVSNCQTGYIESFFEAHGLANYFTDYESAGNTGLHKGENIKLVMERNGLTEAFYVGDTKGDLEAARLAGIPFVYARYGFGDVKEFDFVLDQFAELLDVVQEG